jgi:haloalkane dehalogenase
MILEDNVFVERVLPAWGVRKLTVEEMSAYRAPFLTPLSRRPVWRFPNELPIAGEPAGVYTTLEKAQDAANAVLLPEVTFGGRSSCSHVARFRRGICKGAQELPSGSAQFWHSLYLQEDHPDVVGAAIKEWLIELGVASSPRQKLLGLTSTGKEKG